jgi:hypothetical protein
MQRILGVTLLAAVVGAAVDASAATICVSPSKPACESTIQAGVDAAVAGDTITVSKGRYDENVFVPAGKDGLTIQGAAPGGSSVLDAGLPNIGHALRIESDDVTVDRLTVQNGAGYGIGFVPPANSGTLSDVTIQGFQENCVRAYGNDYTFTGSTFKRCDPVQVEGNDATVTKCSFAYCGEDCLHIEGSDAVVSKNNFFIFDLDAIEIIAVGGAATVTGNRFQDGDTGIRFDGGALTATDNRGLRLNDEIVFFKGSIDDEDDGECSGDSVISDNRIDIVTNDTAFTVSCDTQLLGTTITLENNLVKRAINGGFNIDADDVTLRGNRVIRSGADVDDPCYDLTGNNILAENNFGADCAGGGFLVDGDLAVLRANTAANTGTDGFAVARGTDVLLEGNRSTGNLRFGFSIGIDTANTTLMQNVAQSNREDLCDAGTGTTQSSNSFATSLDPMDLPFIPVGSSYTISDATNATPIVITSGSHGLSSGETVSVTGVTGNTAANGVFEVTVLSSDSFELDGSSGNGAYTDTDDDEDEDEWTLLRRKDCLRYDQDWG